MSVFFLFFLFFLLLHSCLSSTVENSRFKIRVAKIDDVALIKHCMLRNIGKKYKDTYYLQHMQKWQDLALIAEENYEGGRFMGYALGSLLVES